MLSDTPGYHLTFCKHLFFIAFRIKRLREIQLLYWFEILVHNFFMRYSLDAYAPIIQEDKPCSIPIPTPLLNFIFFIIVKSYSCYFILLYSSSLTVSCHSLDVFSPGISNARWANQLSFAAPCQCFTLVGIWMTVPGRISCAGLPSS